MIGKTARSILALLTIGAFILARQVSSRPSPGQPAREDWAERVESVFSMHDGCVDLSGFVGAGAPLSRPSLHPVSADTLEIYEIELPPEKVSGLNARTVAMYVIVAAFVGYALYLFLDPGEKTGAGGDGKDIPDRPFSIIPVSR